MTTMTDKRAAEDLQDQKTKRQNVSNELNTHDKGIAHIKAEYVISYSKAREMDDDEAEGGDRTQETSSSGKKSRRKGGQNKKRDLRQQHEEVRLCTSLTDPLHPGECKFGPESCRKTHDIEFYIASKGDDIAGVCPVFGAIGYCPAGIKCRWLFSHYDPNSKELSRNQEQIELTKDDFELNKVSQEVKFSLSKKKYEYPVADLVIKYIDSQVAKTEDAEIDKKKDNQATYVEQPYKISEKKPMNLKGAKIVSPLTTVGNLPYRRLMRSLGADITYSEMALAIPLLQGTNAEWALPKAHNSEYPGFGVQIATSKHWAAAKVAETLYKETPNVSELNLNCGCPIDLLYRQGQGSALMEQPPRLLRILKAMNACSGDIPVTVKIRTGTKDNKDIAANLVKRILDGKDVSAITLHGRSRQQRYTKEANWDYIKEVGKVVKNWNEEQEQNKDDSDRNPVYFIGNGDVYTHEDWYNAVNNNCVDSVMVARGALIKPWIFEEVEAQQYLDKSSTERLKMLEDYSKFALEHWGTDEYGIGLARRFMCEFLSFTHRYIPIGILERLPPRINQRPPLWKGRDELETLLGSEDYKDWIKITEMFLGKAGPNFSFIPKHKSSAYDKSK